MPKVNHIINSFNAGELSPKMDARIDQEKYAFGCRTLENFIPLIYGGSERRPGLEYIATQKSSSAKGRVVAFEHSVDDTYILLFENQVIRVFRNGAQVLDSVGTNDISALDNVIAHWQLDEIDGTNVVDADGATHDGTATADATVLTTTGKVDTCFNLDGQYTVEVANHADFNFTNGAADSAFSIACWAYVTQEGNVQVLLSKWRDGATTSEWRFSLTDDRKLQLHLSDSSSDLESDRVAQWFLDDNAANTDVDDNVAAIPHDGTASQNTNTAGFSVTGKLGNCFDFNGDQYIAVSDHNELSFGDGTNDSPFSIAAWIYVTNHTSSQTIIAKYDWPDGANVEWLFQLDSDEKLSFSIYDDSAMVAWHRVKTDEALSVGWHFVVATYGGDESDPGNDMIIYVDNTVVDQTADSAGTYTAMENTGENVTIGAHYNAAALRQYFQDKIDNVVLYDIELSAANVSTLWNSGNGIQTTTAIEVFAVSDEALSVGWHFLACTYSAPGSATAASGIILYVDGEAVSSTATNDANYTAMQAGAEEVRIGSQRNSGDTGNENFWGDKIDEVSIYGDVLTPTEIASLYSTTPLEITSPYLTADILSLKFETSADVMFITHPSYESRKLSRINHIVWTLEASDIKTGPFRSENDDTSKTIVASATTGTVTLTAAGHSPFVTGTTEGHEPSGTLATSKSQTGALFKLVHATGTPSQAGALVTNDDTSTHTALDVPKGVTWDFTTNGTWGTAANSASVVLERSYDSGTTYETLVTVTSAANKNITTSGTEEFADAIYRARVSEEGGDASICSTQLSVRDTSHVGIVEITSVTSPTVAIGTVLKTLGSTDLTHRWSEGSFSNYRGWPIDVTISAEERYDMG
jgi:hypothetical protein